MAKADAAPREAAAMPGVQPDGTLPLPWLQASLAAAQQLAGAHALLVQGPAGAGHFELALLVAQTQLCESPRSGPPRLACGRCTSCHLVAGRSHPDLRLVLPAAWRAQRGWTDEEDYIAPKGEGKPSRMLRVEQVRMAIDWAQNTSARGRGKVALLHPAEAMNATAANALLKTLEEPPGALRLLLTTADAEHLLPTVRSRCQRLPLALPPVAEARAWLLAQGLDAPDMVLALAGGSPLEALAWAQDGLTPALLQALPRQVATGNPAPLIGLPVPRVVELLLKLCHDALVQAVGGTPRFFVGASWPPAADMAALHTWRAALLRVARHDEHPWSANLLVEALVAQAAQAWDSAPGQGAAAMQRASLN